MPRDTGCRPVLEHALGHALSYLDSLEDAPVDATVMASELRGRFPDVVPEDGSNAVKVIEELVRNVEGGITGTAGGRFFGWVIGGSLPAALAADWLAAAWDQNAAVYACAPAASVVEDVCGEWLKDLLGLPRESSFALVTGCQMAHLTCLAAARNALLAARDWDVEIRGLQGAPPLTVVTTDQRHETVARAVRLLGIGVGNILEIPTDSEGRMLPSELDKSLAARGGDPAIVVLQAGEINLGQYDAFAELIPIAHRHRAWVHVDGAFGLWANASREHAHLLKGVDGADSWATDGHKWLNVPYDCGYAFVAHPDAHRASMVAQATYVSYAADGRDQTDWNPEWSRRARGFATYAAIRQLGRSGIADLIDRSCRFAQSLVRRIGDLPGAERVGEARVNQGLVRFLDSAPGATEDDHDRRTDAVMESVRKTGEAFFTGTTWRGKRCMRISVSNWLTSERDVERAVAAVASCLGAPALA